MMTHQDVQKKAQQEIDRAVGLGRLPTFSDREQLPYLECILKESLRWYPGTPIGSFLWSCPLLVVSSRVSFRSASFISIGLPHRSMEDDYLKGTFLLLS